VSITGIKPRGNDPAEEVEEDIVKERKEKNDVNLPTAPSRGAVDGQAKGLETDF
jgi:hypothetical protein